MRHGSEIIKFGSTHNAYVMISSHNEYLPRFVNVIIFQKESIEFQMYLGLFYLLILVVKIIANPPEELFNQWEKSQVMLYSFYLEG